MEEEKERGPDLMLVKVMGQFTMKTSACFPILPSWPDILDTMWKCVIANHHFWVKITYSLYFLLSDTRYPIQDLLQVLPQF